MSWLAEVSRNGQVGLAFYIGFMVVKSQTKSGHGLSNILFLACTAFYQVHHILRITVNVTLDLMAEGRIGAGLNVG